MNLIPGNFASLEDWVFLGLLLHVLLQIFLLTLPQNFTLALSLEHILLPNDGTHSPQEKIFTQPFALNSIWSVNLSVDIILIKVILILLIE